MKNLKLSVKYFLFALAFGVVLFSCSEMLKNDGVARLQYADKIKDHDGNEYATLKMGEQTWMAENLQVTHFRNGDPILQVTSNYDWFEAGEQGVPAWRYYSDDASVSEKYGILYNGYAVSDPRGLAPDGWKMPGMDDWQMLMDYLAGGEAEPWPGSTSFMKNEDGEEVELRLNVGWRNLAPVLMGRQTDNPDVGSEAVFKAQFAGQIDQYGNFYGADETAFWWVFPIDFPVFFMGKELFTELGKIRVSKNRENVFASPGFAKKGYAIRLVKE
ncbi:MAG: hypothetical protein EA361_02610 [Bacteroidetes bacterium]|nr:MAG: hypothetical protein EA361_02610 [Bacteroidota bacterium]